MATTRGEIFDGNSREGKGNGVITLVAELMLIGLNGTAQGSNGDHFSSKRRGRKGDQRLKLVMSPNKDKNMHK